MMGHREKLVGGEEYDALTRARKWHGWRSGMIKKVKRRFWKRIRKEVRMELERDC